MTIIINGTTGITTPTTSTTGEFVTSVTGFKNRILNGSMVLDQRNAGASFTPANSQYLADRFQYQTSQASKFSYQRISTITSMPSNFNNYSRFTVAATATVGASDYFAFLQGVEGFNIADLNFGTANAQTITLSFWVRSSVTGTFGGSIQGLSGTYRSYVFSYTISSANTWTQINITIPGDTSAPSTGWGTTNTLGFYVWFGLSVGSSFSGTASSWSSNNYLSVTGNTSLVTTLGATFDITGVQLEKGSTATSFDYRPYGTELALCQRYYFKMQADDTAYQFGPVSADSATRGYSTGTFPVTLRTTPSALEQSGTAAQYTVRTGGVDRASSAVPVFASTTTQYVWVVETTVASGQTAGLGGILYGQNVAAYLGWSAEL